jgi:hypothetical protein
VYARYRAEHVNGSGSGVMIVASDLEGTLSSGETWKAFATYLERDGKSRTYRNFFNTRFSQALLAQTGIINKREFQNRWIEELIGILRRCRMGG